MLREEFYISCSFHLLAMFLTTRSVLEYLLNEGMFIIILNHAEWFFFMMPLGMILSEGE